MTGSPDPKWQEYGPIGRRQLAFRPSTKETSTMVKTVSIVPTWAGLMPALLTVVESARPTEARNNAKRELARLARIGDAAGDLVAYVKQFGEDPKGSEYGLTAKELHELVMDFFDESKPNPVTPPTMRHVAPPSTDPWAGFKAATGSVEPEIELSHDQRRDRWLGSLQGQYARTVLTYIMSLSGVHGGVAFDRIEVWSGDTEPDSVIHVGPGVTELSDEVMRDLVGWVFEIDGPVKYLFSASNGSYPWVQFMLDGIDSNPAELLQDHSTGNWPGGMDEEFTRIGEQFENRWGK